MRFTPTASVALGLVLAFAPGCGRRVEGPNILLITLDTTRRDHLGMYGHTIPTSPNLDRLAQDSLVYTNAYAVSSWTMPTHASIFTGKFPSAHGANYAPDGPLILGEEIGPKFGAHRARPIAENETTLAQILSDHGYATAGIIAGPWLKKRFRLNKGFEHYDDEGVTALNGRPADDVTRAAITYLDEHGQDGFFLFLNYFDPHSPWCTVPNLDAEGEPTEPPQPLRDTRHVLPSGFDPLKLDYRAFVNICYDAEVRYMDAEIGKLLDHLKLRGLYENTWIIVLADHGELIGEPVLGAHDAEVDQGLWGHGESLTEPEIHIPFFVKEPGANPRTGRDETLVQQVDVLPTILKRLGIELPPHIQGKPFGEHHPVVAELYQRTMTGARAPKNPSDWRNTGDWRVLLEDRHKFGWSSSGKHFLIDLGADPGESTNLYGERTELAKHLLNELEGYRKLWPKPGETGPVEQPTEEERKELRALGYTGDIEPSQPPAVPPAKAGHERGQ